MRVIRNIILSILLLTSTANAKSPPPGTGFQDVKANVLIMLDTSGSMGWTISAGTSEYPYDLTFDSSGNVYVARFYSYVEKYNSSGDFQTIWGGYDSGSASDGKFRYIYGIDIDSTDKVYVTDYYRGRIQVFDTSGTHIKNINLSSSYARGIAIDSNDNIYVVNGSGDIEKYNTAGTKLATWTNPNGYLLAVDSSDNVYISEYYNYRVKKYNSSGTLIQTINTSFRPFGIEVDNSGNLYIGDLGNERIYQYNSSGSYVQYWGGYGSSSGKFKNPRGIAMDNSGDLWVADYNNDRIQSPDGTLLLSTSSGTRLAEAKEVIKDLMSNSTLTNGANFGLMEWNSSASMVVPISSTGAASIYSKVDSLSAGGGTYLDYAMSLADSYFTGSSSPMTSGAWCESNLLIVISDGEWVDYSASNTAQSLYNDDIKTFVVGFLYDSSGSGGANYVTLSQNGGTYPDSPVFADNRALLYETIADYILQTISSNLTFSAPTIMPEVTGNDHILQSTFKHKADHQWKGYLNKYELDSDGSIGSLIWEAGSILNNVAAADRNIWTVDHGLSISLNNFTATNRDTLRPSLEENAGTAYSDDELDDLINFIRGIDSYSEYTSGVDDDGVTLLSGERWKLADIYHSRAVVVGTPSAYYSEESATNTESYYRSQNNYSGFRTSNVSRDETIYVGSNGGMLHAFDSDTGAEKWAFIPPSVLPNLKDTISSTANETSSIYGVDGSPVIKDIYYGGAWRTVLISGLRQGGKSYFALDVTDPDDPQHLFTFSHNTITNIVSYWDASGIRTNYNTSSTITAEYDYSDLGESWSKPLILRLPVGSGGAYVWTALFGGGYNSKVNPNYGGNLFVIDLENDGKIINKVTISDTVSGNAIETSVPPRLTAINGDSTTLFTDGGALVYLSDLEGKLWEINLTDNGTLYNTTKIFNAESTGTNARYTFHENAATMTTGDVFMQYYGTGDMQDLGEVNSSIANRIFGIKDTDFPSYGSKSMSTVSSLVDANSSCPTTSDLGWYMDLDAHEKVTAKATVFNSVVLFPRYTPDSASICSAGTAKITEHDFVCGNVLRESDLGYGVPTEAVIYKNKIYLGISTDQAATSLPTGFTKQGNLIVGDPVSSATGKVEIESWWEDF